MGPMLRKRWVIPWDGKNAAITNSLIQTELLEGKDRL